MKKQMLFDSILPRQFYDRDTIVVAKELLGKYLVRDINGELLVGRIVEVEAYLAFDDPASHNYVGITKRNSVMFGEAGHAYVHSMRQYHCFDIVTESMGRPGSVLIRAVEPTEGIEQIKELRKSEDAGRLANGPGKLCQAFGIRRELNGVDVTNRENGLFVVDMGELIEDIRIIALPRVGITKNATALLRFKI